MPQNTDLVTDLPADFEVFGQAVATSMADLLGGPSGYILAKNSATDMDFVWIANDQGDITGITAGNGISVTDPTGPVPTVAINTAVTADLTTAQTLTNKTLTSPVLTTPSISNINAKADVLVGTADNTLGILSVGTNGQVLTADSTVSPTGLKWATPASGGKVLQVVNATITTEKTIATTTLTDTDITATITPTLNTSKILVMIMATQYLSRLSIYNWTEGQVLRGGTTIMDFTTGDRYLTGLEMGNATSTYLHVVSGLSYLDSPATTSATTYKLQARMNAATSSGTTIFQLGTAPSSIILMEIGA